MVDVKTSWYCGQCDTKGTLFMALLRKAGKSDFDSFRRKIQISLLIFS